MVIVIMGVSGSGKDIALELDAVQSPDELAARIVADVEER
jgi:ribose 1,5-bisphosphokinase PhnN